MNSTEKVPGSIIMATGSSRRSEQMARLILSLTQSGAITQHIQIHTISPEKEVTVDESDSYDSGQVSFEKVLAVAFALGIISEDEIGEELLQKWKGLKRLCPQERNIPVEEHVVFYGGDVITLVSTEYNEDTYLELLKITRYLTGDQSKDKLVIQEDKDKIVSIYNNQDGFFVRYKASLVLLSNDVENKSAAITVSLDIIMKLKQFPLQLITDAYLEGGAAFQVGPRLDLAMLAEEYLDENFGIYIRSSSEEQQVWYPITIEIMRGIVLGGLIPPIIFFKVLQDLLFLPHQKGSVIVPQQVHIEGESLVL